MKVKDMGWTAEEASCSPIVLDGSCPWNVVVMFLQIKRASARSVVVLPLYSMSVSSTNIF